METIELTLLKKHSENNLIQETFRLSKPITRSSWMRDFKETFKITLRDTEYIVKNPECLKYNTSDNRALFERTLDILSKQIQKNDFFWDTIVVSNNRKIGQTAILLAYYDEQINITVPFCYLLEMDTISDLSKAILVKRLIFANFGKNTEIRYNNFEGY